MEMYMENVINPVLVDHYKTQVVKRKKLIVSFFIQLVMIGPETIP